VLSNETLALAILAMVDAGLDRMTVLATNERLVHLNVLPRAAHWRGIGFLHRFAQTMAQEPSRLERNAKRAVKLVAADALLAGANQMDRGQPVAHLDMAVLENCPHLDREGLAAGVALVEPDTVGLALERPRAIQHATMRAGTAIGPKACFDVGIGGGFVVELGGGKDGAGHG
jgi:hypothetical protein